MSALLVAVWLSAAPPGALARQQALEAAQALPLGPRVEAVSAQFLGTPYAASPLGEGSGFDPDPLFRWDRVDCLTFVEQTLALALTPVGQPVEPVLNRLRYQGDQPDYAQRNHVMEAQWLPRNLEKGYLRALTRELGGPAVRHVEKVLTAQTWAQPAGKALALPVEAQPQGTFGLDLIPAANAAQALARAPAGAVVVVVRADRPRQVTRVSHVGLLIFKRGQPWLRHASRTFQRVADEALSTFLKRNLDYGSWTIEGLAVFEAQAPAAAPVQASTAQP